MKTMLGVDVNKIDTLKYVRQLRCVVSWIKQGARGTVVAATGFGKTFVAFIVIKKLLKTQPNSKTIVIVPTTALKNQWEKQIKDLKLNNTEVYVVNTIALNNKVYKCDLLIVDEIHMMAAEQFSRIFTLCKYKWILGLTATIERLDGKDKLLKSYAPVAFTITQLEAIEKGWISDYIEINLAVPLFRREVEGLLNLDKQIRYYMSKFGDFEVMQKCMNFENAKSYAMINYPMENYSEKAAEVVKWAVQGQRMIKKRQEFLYKTERKVEVAVELTKEFGLKTIMFSQSTDFADAVCKNLPGSVSYHSNLETITRMVTKKKSYKTLSAAERFKDSKKGALLKQTSAGYEVSWKEPKKYGVKARKDDALRMFKDPTRKCNVICTAKALDQGFDAADIELGIDGSRTSNPTQHIQRTGRVARNFTYKDGTKKRGIYINLFVPESRDEGWLRKCQKSNEDRVLWMNNVNECKTFIKKLLS